MYINPFPPKKNSGNAIFLAFPLPPVNLLHCTFLTPHFFVFLIHILPSIQRGGRRGREEKKGISFFTPRRSPITSESAEFFCLPTHPPLLQKVSLQIPQCTVRYMHTLQNRPRNSYFFVIEILGARMRNNSFSLCSPISSPLLHTTDPFESQSLEMERRGGIPSSLFGTAVER